MFNHLFFDDQKLFDRYNTKRCLGEPELVGVYNDGVTATSLPTPWVFRTDDGKYRMLYQGYYDKAAIEDQKQESAIFFKETSEMALEFTNKTCGLFIAVSDDGIHFTPEDVSDQVELPYRAAPNHIFDVYSAEVGCIIEDPYNDPAERYKMLYCEFDLIENMTLYNTLYVSSDLVHWKKVDGVLWHNGATEPVCGAFYNQNKQCFTLMVRPHAGVRRVGYIETADWRNYTKHTLCMQVDSQDQALAELYGMPAFAYDNWYIGFPYIYGDIRRGRYAKGDGGTMKAQLSYSWDGNHWQRSLREPFISGDMPALVNVLGYENGMVWPSAMLTDENGDLLVYGAATRLEHGPGFRVKNGSAIHVYKVRKDGFVCLKSENAAEASNVATRENIWHAGELHINLKAEHATVAIYEATGEGVDNINGECKLVAGYDHSDCVPFSGDCTNWIPTFKSGKTVNEFAGKTIVIEVRFTNGALYSIYGDCTPIMNVEAGYYRKFGTLPEKSQYNVL